MNFSEVNIKTEVNVDFEEIKQEKIELSESHILKTEQVYDEIKNSAFNYNPNYTFEKEEDNNNSHLCTGSKGGSCEEPHCKKPYECSLCEMKFAQKSHLKRHIICHKGIKPFTCWRCPKKYRDKSTFYKHLIKSHADEKPFQCRLCEQVFSEGDFLVHQKTHKEFSTSGKSHICRICMKTFLEKGELQEHLKNHRGERPFQCGVCFKCFSRKDILRNHMRTHTGEGLYECPECFKNFPTKFNLDEHKNIHNGVKSYECPVCAKYFLRRSGLNRHLKIHSGTIRYECPICHKFFSRDIGAHMKIHTGERNHCCPECGKRFFQNADLSKHMMVHTGEKPYECRVCAKRFSKSFNWKRHEQTHNMADKPHWCPICSRTFISEIMLKGHIANHTTKAGVTVEHTKNLLENEEESAKLQLINIDPSKSQENIESSNEFYPCSNSFSDLKTLEIHIKNHNEFTNDDDLSKESANTEQIACPELVKIEKNSDEENRRLL